MKDRELIVLWLHILKRSRGSLFSAYIFFITSYSIKGSLLFHFLRLASRFYSLPRWALPITFSAFALQITENRNLNWSTLVISTEIFWRQMFYDATVFPNLFSIKIPSNARCYPTLRFNIVFILRQKIFECLPHLSDWALFTISQWWRFYLWNFQDWK